MSRVEYPAMLNSSVNTSLIVAALLLAPTLSSQSQRRVSTIVVKRSPLERRMVVQAEVLPIARTLCIPRVTGYISEIPVREGQLVDRGTPLLRLDCPELAADQVMADAEVQESMAVAAVAESAYQATVQTIDVAKAEIEAAKSQLAASEIRILLAKTELGRTKQLHEQSAATKEDLDRRQIALEEANADLSICRAAVGSKTAQLAACESMTRVKQSEIKRALAQVEMAKAARQRSTTIQGWTVMTNPYAKGLVTRQIVDSGNLVIANQTAVLEIMDVSRVRIRIPIPEAEAALVKIGTSVRLVRTRSVHADIEVKVTGVTAALDAQSRTMAAEIIIDNQDRAWMPGSLCKADIKLLVIADAVMIPNKALVKNGADAFVWIVTDGIAKRVRIKLGVDVGKNIQVQKGLKGGEQIIISGHSGLRDGERVSAKPVEGGS